MGCFRSGKRWPKRRIPFSMTPNARRLGGNNILSAIKQWNDNTNIQLVDMAEWVKGGGRVNASQIRFALSATARRCNSSVGKQGGIQKIRCRTNWPVWVVVHEIGHLLGLYHEQQRMDRDKFVVIDPIMLGRAEYTRNFSKKRPPYSISVGRYDLVSIMHYGSMPGLRMKLPPGRITLATFGPRRRSLGMRKTTWLSKGDVAAINKMYKK